MHAFMHVFERINAAFKYIVPNAPNQASNRTKSQDEAWQKVLICVLVFFKYSAILQIFTEAFGLKKNVFKQVFRIDCYLVSSQS